MVKTIKRDKVISSMKKKGFEVTNKKKDHYYCTLKVNGKLTSIRTRISAGSNYNQLGIDIITGMSKDLKMDKNIFLEFVDCTYTYDNYITALTTKNLLVI